MIAWAGPSARSGGNSLFLWVQPHVSSTSAGLEADLLTDERDELMDKSAKAEKNLSHGVVTSGAGDELALIHHDAAAGLAEAPHIGRGRACIAAGRRLGVGRLVAVVLQMRELPEACWRVRAVQGCHHFDCASQGDFRSFRLLHARGIPQA